jgi:Cu/Ag efflux pump CusA
MSGIPNLEQTRSISRYGLSQVTVIFKDGTDIYWARQQITEQLQKVKQEIQGVIIGDDSNPGLKKYIQELFTLSTHSTDDKIYAFTSRVLQGLFKKVDRAFPCSSAEI